MSSKFFTWGHKGDKKSSQYGVVTIPAECITIHGIDSKGTHKTRRKPLPLDLYQAPNPGVDERSRADGSIAFHDAAVQSATSLLAVINDCLKSPPLSAHFQSSQQHSVLQPLHGRPRSRTAPSTPMAEAPSGSQTSPVELPGSMPVVRRSHASHQSMDSRALRNIMTGPANSAAYGQSIERPHSSPQETTYQLPSHPRQSSDSFSRGITSLQPPADPVPRSKTSSPYKGSRSVKPSPFTNSDDTLVASENDVPSVSMKPPSMSMFHEHGTRSHGALQSQTSSQLTSSRPNLQSSASMPTGNVSKQDDRSMLDTEALLVEQISTMRAAHDAHLKSLKETHEKEIASHRSYVSFLEKRIASQPSCHDPIKQHLTLDTSHLPNKELSLLSSEASATTSMQSFELTLEGQKRASSEAAAEAQKLRRERDHFKDAAERHERKVTQLRGMIRKARDNEGALRNAITGLEASLQAANNERLDVLEGFHEACEQVRMLGKERDEFRNRLHCADPIWKETDTVHCRCHDRGEPEELIRRHTSLRRDALLQQLDEVRQALSERNMKVDEMQQQMACLQQEAKKSDTDDKTANEGELEHCRKQLAAAQADRDRYNSLLHTELRRQSRLAAQKAHTTTPQLETEALKAMRERLIALKYTSDTFSDINAEDLAPTVLEKELEHCFREIIMFKLDIKGYKKDLKLANAELDQLRRSKDQVATKVDFDRSATPGRGETTVEDCPEPSSGLGITLPPPPTTPQRSVGSARAPPPPSASSTPQHTAKALSPTNRPKTPLGVHKKLPRPPPQSRTPSPYLPCSPPRAEVQRQETMRSLSESIISSYAKRSTPEQGGQGATPPPRGRSSDPPRAATTKAGEDDEGNHARAVPMGKFTPRMLRTSAKVVGTPAV